MGPFTLSTRPAVLEAHFARHPGQRVLFVARPGDVEGGYLLETVRDRAGEARFEIIEVSPRQTRSEHRTRS
jgi:hypothetical protein